LTDAEAVRVRAENNSMFSNEKSSTYAKTPQTVDGANNKAAVGYLSSHGENETHSRASRIY